MSNEQQALNINYIERDVKATAVIFDLDGCVSDDRWRAGRLPTGDETGLPMAYDFYHAGCGDDAPLEVGAGVLRDSIEEGHFIIFATARPEKVIEMTSTWIQRHFFIRPNKDFMILCRPDSDPSPSVVLKSKFVDFLQGFQAESGRRVIAAYDDRQDVVDMYEARGLNATAIDHLGIRTSKGSPENVDDQDGPIEDEAAPAGVDLHIDSCYVADILDDASDTFRDRRSTYGSNDIVHGRVMKVLFPNGVQLVSEHDHRMFLMFTHAVGKMTRFAASGLRHQDSAHDMVVYSAFLDLLAEEHEIKVLA